MRLTPQCIQTAVCAKRAKKPYNFCFKREQSSFELIPVGWQQVDQLVGALCSMALSGLLKTLTPFFFQALVLASKVQRTKIVKYPTKIQSWHRPIHKGKNNYQFNKVSNTDDQNFLFLTLDYRILVVGLYLLINLSFF